MNRNDKRASVCGLAFLPLSQATVRNFPGSPDIGVHGTFTPVPVSSAEYGETGETGSPIEQELEAVVTETSSAKLNELRTLFAEAGLVLLDFTNGERRVVGSDEFPVQVNTELSGTPASLSLTFKRDSPEPAKVYSSF